MIRAISALLLTVLSITASSDPEAFSLSKFDHFVKVPYANLHAGGRLTERHIGYIAEAGYSSLLSISEFATNDTVYNGVSGSFPSSQSEVDIATSYGLSAQYTASSLTTDFLAKFVTILDSLKTPVYIHCHVGYTATLFTELYLYTKGTVKSSAEIYANGLKYGWDYQSNADVVAFVNTVTGAADTVQPESIEQTLAAGESSYKYYYWSHRAGESDLWFNQGQILDTHVPAIVTAGYKTVVSFRDNGEATNRLPGEDAAAAGASNGEFSDAATGLYNVTAESLSVAAAGLSFYHLPLVSGATQTWTVEQYNAYLPTLQAAQARGPVLAHCASGYRSSTYVLAFLAQQGKQCTAWALAQAANMGIVLDSSAQTDTDRQVIAFWQQILGC